MPLPTINPRQHRLFLRTWRPTCPIRPRHSRFRRWARYLLLVLSITLLSAYVWITDADRVQRLAEGYLERLVGGDVTIERASLGLFDGLRLDGVSVRVPDSDGGDDEENVVFTARSVTIDYDPMPLVLGRLSVQSIRAIDPHVRLVENLSDGTWNVQGLGMFNRRSTGKGKPFRPPGRLPAIALRNAQVDYARRAGTAILPRGGIGIEASMTPVPNEDGTVAYQVNVQTLRLEGGPTRDVDGALGGAMAMLGPELDATLRLGRTGGLAEGAVEATARLQNVDFRTFADLLPRQAADWARRHAVAGRMEVPQIDYRFDPNRPTGDRTGGRLHVKLSEGRVQGLPEEWLPPEEIALRAAAVNGATRLANGPAWLPGWIRGSAGELAEAWRPKPIRLDDVDGDFIFTDDGVIVRGLVGSLEGQRLRVSGVVDGYDPGAGMSFVVSDAAPDGRGLILPPDLPYLASLPKPVRELHQRFQPSGRCRLRLEVHRDGPTRGPNGRAIAARPTVSGRLDILGGSFELERLPYRVYDARGRLLIRQVRNRADSLDAGAYGQDELVIENLVGRGDPSGPNASARLVVNGSVTPLNSVAGFDITVVGSGIRHEPALIAALPEPARRGIEAFDPALRDDAAGLPALDFAGDFVATVNRPAGPDRRWEFGIELDLATLSGAIGVFPYPLQDAAARVTVTPAGAILHEAHMTRTLDDGTPATFAAEGSLAWGRRDFDAPDRAPPLRYDLTLTAQDVPTDAALRRALPAVARDALADLGIDAGGAGTAHVWDDGTGLNYDVAMDVRGGRFWPAGDTFSLADVAGRVRLLPDRVELGGVTARRGDGRVGVSGSVGLGDAGRSDLRLALVELPLDGDVYQLLPPAAQAAWDWLRPRGGVSGEVTLALPTALLAGEPDAALPTDDDAAVTFAATLRPDGLSVKPAGFPYALQNVRGEITVTPEAIVLAGVTAEHAVPDRDVPARLSFSGTGDLTDPAAPAGAWDLWVSANRVPVDADLRAALPPALGDLAESLALGGDLSVSELSLSLLTRPAADGAAEAPTPDVAFDGTLLLAKSAFDIGVAVTDFNGAVKLSGAYEAGELREVRGTLRGDSFEASERPASDLSATFALERGEEVLHIDPIGASVAGGLLDGSAALDLSGKTTQFTVDLAVRDVDVQALLGPDEIGAGRLTAGLRLSGGVGDAASREGRGQVLVRGRELMRLPLVLGLLQVTNLALPIAEPFSEAEVDFDISGPVLHFRRLEARAVAEGAVDLRMKLTGSGTLDYDTGQIVMTFNTSNRGWDAIPLVGDLVGMARNELVGVQVTGTLEKPELSGRSLPTVRGTFGRVMGGG